jgi:hypothetical protein
LVLFTPRNAWGWSDPALEVFGFVQDYWRFFPSHSLPGVGPTENRKPSGLLRITGSFSDLFRNAGLWVGFLVGLWCLEMLGVIFDPVKNDITTRNRG